MVSPDSNLTSVPSATVKTPIFIETTELIKASYPVLCFLLAGVLGFSAAAHSDRLDDGRWNALLGLSAAAITAGAGIAQAPRKD